MRPEHLHGLSVLVIDDNATSRMALAEILAHAGLRPAVVDGALAGWRALEDAIARASLPRVVVVDHQMPEMDGFTLVARMKADPSLAGIASVMVSSSGLPGDSARAAAAGVDVFLTKPVSQPELIEAILSTLAPTRSDSAPAPPERTPRTRPRQSLHVLLAEDNSVNQIVASRILEQQGHRVVVVETGRAALVALERERFDVVLMDVQMPDMDGLEATAAIRAREAATAAPGTAPTRIPILALTAHAMAGDAERCHAAGADAYLSKPINATTLVRTIEQLVPPGGEEAAASDVPLDLTVTLTAVAGNRALLGELAQVFATDCSRRVAELKAAVSARDAERIHQAAHAIKGAVATLGATRARDLATRLESAGRQGRLDGAPALEGALTEELRRITAFLTEPGAIDRALHALDTTKTTPGLLPLAKTPAPRR